MPSRFTAIFPDTQTWPSRLPGYLDTNYRTTSSFHTLPGTFLISRGGGNEHFHRWLLLLIGAFAFIHWLNSRRWFAESWRQWPAPVFAAAYGCTFAVVLLFVPPHYTPFIYFQF